MNQSVSGLITVGSFSNKSGIRRILPPILSAVGMRTDQLAAAARAFVKTASPADLLRP
jgi:hypothetical protein